MSTNMDFLEQYQRASAGLRGKHVHTELKECHRCYEVLSIAAFSVDKKQKDQVALICTTCNRDACELSRLKKRIWAEEDEHYKVPGGMRATKFQRLKDVYQKPFDDEATVLVSVDDMMHELRQRVTANTTLPLRDLLSSRWRRHTL